jgi:O-antigen/teichoic acid export membrane protein
VTRFDVSSVEGRNAERYRLAALGTLANFASRAASMLAIVLTVHLAAPVLGAERFGVWATFTSLVAALSFLDLGVGNALINRVASAAAGKDPAELQRVVGAGIGWLALIGGLVALCLAIVALAVPWDSLFKLSSSANARETRDAALVFSGLFGLHTFSSGLLKLLIGQQRAYEAHLIAAAAAIAACVVVAYRIEPLTSVGDLLLMLFGVQSIAGLCVLPLLMMRGQLDMPGLPAGMRAESNELLRTGSLFFVLQVGTMVGWGADSLMVAGLGGAADVAAFAIVLRLFQFASQPVAVLNSALWAAYADANARGDRDFIRQTLKRSAIVSVGGGGTAAILLFLLGPWIIPRWTQDAIDAPISLLAAFALWTVVEVGGIAFGTYLNGVGIVREQVMVVVTFCFVAVPLKVWAMLEAGATGLVVATTLAYVLTVGVLYGFYFRRRVLEPLRGPA